MDPLDLRAPGYLVRVHACPSAAPLQSRERSAVEKARAVGKMQCNELIVIIVHSTCISISSTLFSLNYYASSVAL